MRLRLRVRRNELPTISVVWPVDDLNSRQTISQFLVAVNERIPLECDSWGLEDYSVTIADFEVFHYDVISAVCKDEDEVVIRPLSFAEVRARTLAGRAQITPDGRHLVDGVAFGRPLLKRPARPDVTIPPRKRQRVEDDNNIATERRGELVPFGDIADENDGEDEDDDEDEDFELGESEHDEEEDQSEDEDEQTHGSENGSSKLQKDAPRTTPEKATEIRVGSSTWQQQRAARAALRSSGSDRRSSIPLSVTFAHDSEWNSEPESTAKMFQTSSSADEIDGESESDSSDDSSISESDDSSSDSESDSEDSSDGSTNGVSSHLGPSAHVSNPKSKRTLQTKVNQGNDPAAAAAASSALTNSKSELQIKQLNSVTGVPYQGSPATKNRNQRRTESKRLAFLKKTNRLPKDATLEDMRIYSAQNDQISDDLTDFHQTSKPATDNTDDSLSRGPDLVEELERRRQKLLNDLASGGIDVSENAESSKKASCANPKGSGAGMQEALPVTAALTTVDPTSDHAATGRRRATLNVSSTDRMIFASLGVRVPKSAEERQKLQEKLDNSTTRPVLDNVRDVSGSARADQVSQEPDLWRRRISLSAVECCDEGVVLSAPPFPFQQRWDPKYQIKKKRSSNLYGETRSKKRKGNKNAYIESYDKYNTDGNGDALNYDDDDESAMDEYWEDGALLDGERGYDDQQQAELDRSANKFPDLPADLNSLPIHTEAKAVEGDIVVFTELGCNAATNWQPRMVTRTALLTGKDGNDWLIQLAPRDLPPKKYDEDGNRVYEKFETMEDEDSDDDEGRRTLSWAEMIDPRLLLPAVSAVIAEP